MHKPGGDASPKSGVHDAVGGHRHVHRARDAVNEEAGDIEDGVGLRAGRGIVGNTQVALAPAAQFVCDSGRPVVLEREVERRGGRHRRRLRSHRK